MQGDMKNLTKRQVAVQIAEETGLTQQEVLVVIQKTLDIITEALKDGRSPHKPDEVVVIPRRKSVRFRPGKTMKAMIN